MAISVVDVSGRTGRHSRIGGGENQYNGQDTSHDGYSKKDNNIYSPNSIIFPKKRLLPHFIIAKWRVVLSRNEEFPWIKSKSS